MDFADKPEMPEKTPPISWRGRATSVIRSFRFSIGGLLLTVLAVAVGMAIGSSRWWNWQQGLEAAFATLLICGLIQQIVFLARSKGSKDQQANTTVGGMGTQRIGIRLAVFYRGMAILLFILAFGCYGFARYWTEVISAQEAHWALDNVAHPMCSDLGFAIHTLLLIAIFWYRPRRTPTRFKWLFPLRAGASVVLLLLMLREQTIVHFLVHLAVTGIEFSHWTPADVSTSTLYRSQFDPIGSSRSFFYVSIAGLALALTTLGALICLSIHWRNRLRWFAALSIWLSGNGVLVAYLFWVYQKGLVTLLNAYETTAFPNRPILDWVAGGILILMLNSWLASRLTWIAGSRETISLEMNKDAIHWRPLVIFFGCGVYLWSWVWSFIEKAYVVIRDGSFENAFFGVTFLELFGFWFTTPSVTLSMILALAMTCLLWRQIRGTTRRISVIEIETISLGPWIFFHFATAFTLVTSITAFAWFAYAYWFWIWTL